MNLFTDDVLRGANAESCPKAGDDAPLLEDAWRDGGSPSQEYLHRNKCKEQYSHKS